MAQNDQTWHLDTVLIHGGRDQDRSTSSGTPTISPIYASTTYLHKNVEALDEAFSGTGADGRPAFVYARQTNPNANALETVLAQAEGGVGAVAFSSGMAAVHAALLASGLAQGTKIVISQDLYGPTFSQLKKLFAPNNVQIVISDLCHEGAADFIREEEPDVVYVETISNPLVKVIDLDAISAAAREVGAVTIVDSTFTTPYLVRPLEHGFDMVVHSTTKYVSGHGDSTGGVVISKKNVLLDQLRSHALLLGAMLSPFESHLQIRGLRTLPLRMEKHSSNALQVARFLQEHSAIERVHYPGLPEHPQHELASCLLKPGLYGGLLSFELKEQTREAAMCCMNKLQLCLPATSLGDVFSLVSYPPVSSHRTLSNEERHGMGITDGCIRLSVGIEHVEDIIKDLDQALQKR
ncbi:MAG: PLP-dependent transferase [Ktedonobacteraceae bacterium]|nr:PLP-dependent transferase [Ktedonobacteraceae bacterium]